MKKKIALGVGAVLILWIMYDAYWAHMEDEHEGEQ